MCKNSCLCWRDLMTPSIAVVVFSMTSSVFQILVEVAVFTGNQNSAGVINYNDALGTAVKLYIALACFDFFVVLFGIIFLLAVERTGGHRYSALPWIIWIIPYIIFESAVNIYYFSDEFQSNGYYIVPLVYWVVKDIILFIGWWCVVSRLCYWNHTSTGTSDTNLLLTRPAPIVSGGVGPTDSFGPMYYTGAATQVQIRENPRSHFEVNRPAPNPSFQVYNADYGRNVGYYGRDGGLYGQPRYVYN